MAALNDTTKVGLANRFKVDSRSRRSRPRQLPEGRGPGRHLGHARLPRRRRRQRALVLPGEHEVHRGEADPGRLGRLARSATWLDQNSFNFQTQRLLVTIELFDSTGKAPALLTWDLRNAQPKKWSINNMDAGASQISVETLEFDHEGFLEDETTIG